MKKLILLLALYPGTVEVGNHITCFRKFTPLPAEHAQVKCLATMIYGEARGESLTGKIAVAYTAVNRATKRSVCQVVLAKKQYSIFNDNPALRAAALSVRLEPMQSNSIDKRSWAQSMKVAHLVIKRQVSDPTYGATHYVAYQSLTHIPKWTKIFNTVVKIGNHTFFKERKH